MTLRHNDRWVNSFSLCIFFAMFLSACATGGSSNSSHSAKTKRGSDNALIHAQLAKGYLQQKQYSIAKDELEKALSIDSNHSDSNYIMALLMMELEQYEETETHFARAVKSDPENASAAHDFGMFLCQIGKERESVGYFEIAAKNALFEKQELSFMRAGECLARINDSSAESYLKHALSIDPKLKPALYRLALLKYDSASYFSARAYIERYMAITKPQPAALLLAYKIESKLNATDVADEYRKQILENFSGSQQASDLRSQQRNR